MFAEVDQYKKKQRHQCLKLDTVELQRLYIDMKMMYKIIHGLIDVAFDDLFTFLPNRSTCGHVYKLYCSKSNLNVRSHCFSQQLGTFYQMMLLHHCYYLSLIVDCIMSTLSSFNNLGVHIITDVLLPIIILY